METKGTPTGFKSPSKQGFRWDENGKPPKNVYRYVDQDGNGLEASAVNQPFKVTNWNNPKEDDTKEEKKQEWYDATEHKHRTGGLSTDHYRPATPNDEGYEADADVPVYVKKRYRPKAGSKKSRGYRSPALRALDRTARVLSGGLDPKTSSPHLAAVEREGRIEIAGNTGPRYVEPAESQRGQERLTEARNLAGRLPTKDRARQDAIKLRAMVTGDYQAQHAEAAPELHKITAALDIESRWRNIGVGGSVAEHGELTLLRALLADMKANKNAGVPKTVHLGGVKQACQACWLAINAFNQHLAAGLGYKVLFSGTHMGLFPAWKIPDFLWEYQDEIAGKLPAGWTLEDGLLFPDKNTSVETPYYQDPEDSASEWEEIS